MLAKNTISPPIGFSLINAADASANTTATPTVEVCKDSGGFAAATNAAVRKGSTNAFHVILTAAEMNADTVGVRITALACVPQVLWLYPESTWTATKAGYLDESVSATLSAEAATVNKTEVINAIDALNNLSAEQAETAAANALSSYEALTRTEATADKDAVIAAVEAVDVDLSNVALEDTALEILAAINTAGDPLTNIVPGQYAPGTAGYALAYLGDGSVLRPFVSTVNGVPTDGVLVAAFADAAMTQPIAATQVSRNGGQTYWLIRPNTTYWFFQQKPGIQFTNPEAERYVN